MPIARSEVAAIVAAYSAEPVVAAVGSHSALDIADGASSEGFRTLVLAQKGRDRTYSQYYRTRRDAAGRPIRGCVDEVWTYAKFSDLAAPDQQVRLRAASGLLVPNRALSSYVDLSVLENDLRVPIVGSRALLRIEERTERNNYYSLLEHAGIPTPSAIPDPASIDGLAIVKLPHATKRLERGFFTVASPAEFARKRDELLRRGTITLEDLATARIERYILGPVFNFNFFYSPLAPRDEALELLGVDERRESSLDGLVRLPASQQLELAESGRNPEYTVVGHGTLTVRESILEEVFAMGEKFVAAARDRYPPGIIGPFCLQTCLDPDGRPWVFDVAVRIGGGTNIHLGVGHPYGNALWRGPMSSGRRIAREIRQAIAERRLSEIVT
ncbi:MAG: formate--phosphoribosylaminoimidazolecarboxamide ligase family protein [Thermoplasmata archaeon]|nr:formate--phosphoribosylaminoimidazolecarboxamide ligase family protein [Thermoplasmata archaeon]MCI4354286.1 formate--phosphoribosylaminoimidazolecarboxamide ligase family protein [Thermoplasmata archaeon]